MPRYPPHRPGRQKPVPEEALRKPGSRYMHGVMEALEEALDLGIRPMLEVRHKEMYSYLCQQPAHDGSILNYIQTDVPVAAHNLRIMMMPSSQVLL